MAEEYQEHSLGGRVFQKIREDILSGKYQENQELRENTLGKELGVSRTPVREALRQLELEGLVTIIPNKGAYVTGFSEKDIQDIYMICMLLEGLCARWATEHITQQQLDELDEVILLSEFYMKKDSNIKEQMVSLDSRFHEILYAASDSRFLSRLLNDFNNYVKSITGNILVSTDRMRKSVREHKQILRAIRDGDADMAEQLASEHVMHMLQGFKKKGMANK